MKNLSKLLTLVLIFLFLQGCGKSARDKKSPDTIIDNSVVTDDQNKAGKELRDAIVKDDVEDVKEVIKVNIIDINETNGNGNTPLIEAIQSNSSNVRDYLLERGANVDVPDSHGETPLMIAIRLNQIETIRILISKGAVLDKKNKEGETALHIAIKKDLESIAIILVESGANIKITDHDNLNAYDLAVLKNMNDLEEILKKLLVIEVTAPDIYIFKETVTSGDSATLAKMLHKYKDLASTYEMINPLCLSLNIAENLNGLEVAQILLQYEVNPNGPYNSNCIPLIESVKTKKISFINLLLEHKAKVHILDSENKSPLIHAIHLNNEEMVEILLNYSAPIDYKYVSENGTQGKVQACDVARKVRSKLKKDSEKKINKRIKDRLDCGFWDWLF
jgi:ankyrin repeat protein